jgi:hypothetical protein
MRHSPAQTRSNVPGRLLLLLRCQFDHANIAIGERREDLAPVARVAKVRMSHVRAFDSVHHPQRDSTKAFCSQHRSSTSDSRLWRTDCGLLRIHSSRASTGSSAMDSHASRLTVQRPERRRLLVRWHKSGVSAPAIRNREQFEQPLHNPEAGADVRSHSARVECMLSQKSRQDGGQLRMQDVHQLRNRVVR